VEKPNDPFNNSNFRQTLKPQVNKTSLTQGEEFLPQCGIFSDLEKKKHQGV